MMLALDQGGQKTTATPGARAACPTCDATVIAKCGQLVAWHWAHQALDCDPWAEPDSAWHHGWQALVPPERREVTIGAHRADIVTPSGTVVELQTRALPADEVAARERHYGRMVWLFDCRAPAAQWHATEGRTGLDLRRRSDHWTFRWKHPRKSVALPRCPVFLDVGNGNVFELRRIHLSRPCGGWGRMWRQDQIINSLNRQAPQ